MTAPLYSYILSHNFTPVPDVAPQVESTRALTGDLTIQILGRLPEELFTCARLAVEGHRSCLSSLLWLISLSVTCTRKSSTVCVRNYCFQLLGSAPPLFPYIAGQNCTHSVSTAPVDHSSIGSQALMTFEGSLSPEDRCWEKLALPLFNLMTCHGWTSVKKYACSAKGTALGHVQSGGHLCLWQVTWCSWLCIFPSVSSRHTGRIVQIRGFLLNLISYQWLK